jgi:DNA-binding NarL/FixJ family response regulator
MNVIMCTDSSVLYDRLTSLLSVLADVNVAGVTKDLTEVETAISSNNVQVLIIAFHRTDKTVFKKLNGIKNRHVNLKVIVLSNNRSEDYLSKWRKTGADYVFDQAMHFNKVVDILSGLIYKNLLEVLKSSQKVNHSIPENKPDQKKLI